MSANSPWSIKGIDSKTREKIKKKAKQSGMTLGEWISNAVANNELNVEQESDSNTSTKKESKVNNRQQRAVKTANGETYYFEENEPNDLSADDAHEGMNDMNNKRRANHLKTSRFKVRNSNPASYRPEHQMSSGFNVIESALTDIVDHIELSDRNNSTALRNMQMQIAHLNQKAKTEQSPVVPHVLKEFETIEGKLENLAERIEELNANNATMADSFQDKQQMLEQELQNRANFEQSNMLSRFDELFIKLDNLNQDQHNHASSMKFLEEDMQSKLSDISEGLQSQVSDLTEGLQDQLNAGNEAYVNEFDNMDGRIADLNEKFDHTINNPSVDPQIGLLENQINDLSSQLADLIQSKEEAEAEALAYELEMAEQEDQLPEYVAEMQGNIESLNEKLEQSISEINQRLDNTEERLVAVDRIEDNMEKLISSVSDIKDNSHDVAKDAAMSAIAEFSKNQNNDDSEHAKKEDVDALVSEKLGAFAKKNAQVQKEHLAGFKTVQNSLETIMERLNKVEHEHADFARREPAPMHAPPEPHYQGDSLRAPQSFMQPGAEMSAEQSQDIPANHMVTENIQQPQPMAEPNMAMSNQEVTPNAEPMMTQANMAEPVIQQPNQPQAQMNPIEAEAQITMNAQEQNMNVAPTDIPSDMTSNIAMREQFAQADMPSEANNIIPSQEEQLQAQAAPSTDIAELSDQTGLGQTNERPQYQETKSSDFIAAAREAAKAAYDNETATPVAAEKPKKSFFKRRVKEEPSDISDLVSENLAQAEAEVKTESKSLFSRFRKNKDDAVSDVITELNQDTPRDMFDNNFFNGSNIESDEEQVQNIGNVLDTKVEKKKKSLFSNINMPRPIVMAILFVLLASAAAFYFVSGSDNSATNQVAAKPPATNGQVAPTNGGTTAPRVGAYQPPAPTQNGTPTNAPVPHPTYAPPAPQGNTQFTPKEFTQFNQNGTQAYQPNQTQINALNGQKPLVTNSIPKFEDKPYTKSLLDSSNSFEKGKTANKKGSSSLTKSKGKAATVPVIKSGSTALTGELPEAIGPKQLRDNAKKGMAAEQFEIANRFALGVGVPIDMNESFDWFVKAADNNLAVAQFSAGMMLENGKGTLSDMDRAKTYYQGAAEQGNLMAIYRMAMINASPRNPLEKPDYKTAIKWFNMAANAGFVDAQFNLAVLYEKGHGTKVDLPQAYKWYKIAANKGDKQAKKRADLIKLEMSTSQIQKAKSLVASWKPTRLPKEANVAPKLAYLKSNGADNVAAVTTSKHVKPGVLSNDIKADTKAIKSAQKMLKILGWEVGPVDGIMGSKTRKAIIEFQKRHNLVITGFVNDELLSNLEDATL